MQTEHKKFIVEELNALCDNLSQKKIAKRAMVSEATISQMRNGNWDLIRDEMWSKVKVNLSINWSWVSADTSNLLLLKDLMTKAQKHSMSMCVSDRQGMGKTHAYKEYHRNNKNVILIRCKNSWKQKSFARHQLIACGLETGGTTEEMIDRFTDYLKNVPKALVMYDQFDKLKDSQKDLFMDFYDDLDGNTGFILSGVSLEKQEKKGCSLNKMGYRERFSRYGSKFIHLNTNTIKDVTKICVANGVSEKEIIADIFDDCMGDLRRVKRLIERYFIEQSEIKTA